MTETQAFYDRIAPGYHRWWAHVIEPATPRLLDFVAPAVRGARPASAPLALTPRPTMGGRPSGRSVVQMDDRGAGVTYRPATEDDIEAEHRVFVAAEGDLLERHGFAWPAPPPLERHAPSLRHLIRTDGARAFVAVADGAVVGYSNAFIREDAWFLASLFIAPGYQGRGIGRRLIERSIAGAPRRRMTITDAIQPISNALYARFGLLPATPIIGFAGASETSSGTELVAAEATPDELGALDRIGYGFDRAIDHAFWRLQAEPTLWRRSGEPVAYSYRWPSGRIGPICGRDGSSAADALRAELLDGAPHRVDIPGSSRALMAAALGAGLQLRAPAGLLLVSDDAPLPTSLAISSYGLF